MPARLRAQPIAVADPTRAAHQVAAAALGDAPRARPLLVVVARWGAHPGLRPSPWSLDGVMHAIEEGGLRARALHVGERGATDPVTAQLAARGVAALEPRGPTVSVRPAGSRHALRVPAEVIGNNLCLVLPCVHHQHPSKDGPAWRGPIGAGLVALASAWGGSWARDPVDGAARVMAELFAHVSVVIDGSWWAPLDASDDAAPLLLSPERALGLRLASPVTGPSAVDPQLADAWLGAKLGLPQRRRQGDTIHAEGSAAHSPWPQLPRTAPRETGLANQALGALWRRVERPAPRRTALPPAVPGPLAELWSAYGRPPRPA